MSRQLREREEELEEMKIKHDAVKTEARKTDKLKREVSVVW